MTETDDFAKEWTGAEAAILRGVAERKGEEWVRAHAEHVRTQARLVGERE